MLNEICFIFFIFFQRRIKSIQQLAQMKPRERQSMLRFLSEDQYNTVIKVMSSMPLVELRVRSEGTVMFPILYYIMGFNYFFSSYCVLLFSFDFFCSY